MSLKILFPMILKILEKNITITFIKEILIFNPKKYIYLSITPLLPHIIPKSSPCWALSRRDTLGQGVMKLVLDRPEIEKQLRLRERNLPPHRPTLETKMASGVVGQWGKWGLHKIYICFFHGEERNRNFSNALLKAPFELEKAPSDLEKAPSEVVYHMVCKLQKKYNKKAGKKENTHYIWPNYMRNIINIGI